MQFGGINIAVYAAAEPTEVLYAIVIFFILTGVAVKIGASSNQLDIMLIVGQNYSQVGNRGLFGVHNGDPSDDLTTPEGAIISSNRSEDLELIHNEFGEKCKTPFHRMF